MSLKDIFPLLAPVITILLAWLVGHRLSAYWAERQKRREVVLTATNEFYKLYGEFFAVWKLWNYSIDQVEDSTSGERRWKLHERAAAAEASMESMMVNLASERVLTEDQVATLGRFRQAYQSLREAIAVGKKLSWYFDEHPEYLAFKRLAAGVARLVSAADGISAPKVERAQEALRVITSNQWESNWIDVNTSGSRERLSKWQSSPPSCA